MGRKEGSESLDRAIENMCRKTRDLRRQVKLLTSGVWEGGGGSCEELPLSVIHLGMSRKMTMGITVTIIPGLSSVTDRLIAPGVGTTVQEEYSENKNKTLYPQGGLISYSVL